MIVAVVVCATLPRRTGWHGTTSPPPAAGGLVPERIDLAGTAVSGDHRQRPVRPVGRGQFDRSARPWAPRAAGAHDVAYRLARHAGTMTADVPGCRQQLGDLRYVELCAIVSTVAAVAHFSRNIGVAVPPLTTPSAADRDPARTWRRRGTTGYPSPNRPTAAGRRSGVHSGPRRAAQHVADGRRPVHARSRDGESGVDAPSGRPVARRRWSSSRLGSPGCASASIE